MTCVKVIVDTDRAAIDSGIHRHTLNLLELHNRPERNPDYLPIR
ncbi:hypothetical protein MYCO108962_19065 [Mycobacterium colombiense]|uniref:Uncharacterized protein n=1 Tax=Mycobacterium [tuberculosis] TKK-01-0051 TaxID=1324261 RepID=A0A051U3Z4_9MYCO|nr:hypothetical protein K875_02497 [Mycobacterium [tuberculosis] TKK-01-0051]